jgi:hypothetical protein
MFGSKRMRRDSKECEERISGRRWRIPSTIGMSPFGDKETKLSQ